MTDAADSGMTCVNCSLNTGDNGKPQVVNKKLAAQRKVQTWASEYADEIWRTDPQASETAGGTMSNGLTDAWTCAAADEMAASIDMVFSAVQNEMATISGYISSAIGADPSECVDDDDSAEATWITVH
ncbi:penicillin binding protein [Actinomyces sp. Chiba101]|uniref:hypothetical protein n=1 Tax=Actinomyces TaxID=1654 RepID=UPI000974F5B1|nr:MULTISPECIES: hypothetical protein [Actinomyces]BAW94122.1 penicillin binding protein [Actinomyces sp. Chiba101]GAV95319.1 penicillin-binding protein [Actinomyces denticolens]SUU13733.1 Uncharacterised protein [Actinomyces denticolens]